MTRALRFFRPGVVAVLLGLVCSAGAVTLLWAVTVVHGARDAEQRLCRMQVELVKARNVFAQRFICPSDPCRCIEVVAGLRPGKAKR